MTACFVTGTGTDIGKTFVTAGLVRALRRDGRTVEALKPVISGFDAKAPEASDTGILLAALDRPASAAEIHRISPWRFKAPLSPDMAARIEGKALDFDALLAFSRHAVAANPDMLLIEGVGGIMSPLDDRHTMLDWMAALDLPLVLVGGSYLGAISHSLSALDVLGRRGLRVLALVVNESAESTVPLDSTIEAVARFAPSHKILAQRRLAGGETEPETLARLAGLIARG